MRNDLSLYCGPVRHPAAITTRIVFAALLLWFFAIAVLTVLIAVGGIDWVGTQVGRGPAFDQSMLAALTVTAIVVMPTLSVRLMRPQLTLSVLALMTSTVVIVLATGAGALLDLFLVVRNRALVVGHPLARRSQLRGSIDDRHLFLAAAADIHAGAARECDSCPLAWDAADPRGNRSDHQVGLSISPLSTDLIDRRPARRMGSPFADRAAGNPQCCQ
jgi:hypothetical protein